MTTDPRLKTAVERELNRAPAPTPERRRRLASLMGLSPAPRQQQDDSTDDKDAA